MYLFVFIVVWIVSGIRKMSWNINIDLKGYKIWFRKDFVRLNDGSNNNCVGVFCFFIISK